MRSGEIVELAPAEQLFKAPAHPYTRELLSLMPRVVGEDVDRCAEGRQASAGTAQTKC
jgi:oligopeptide/dipeptide ABC transporter ATP-binding protein